MSVTVAELAGSLDAEFVGDGQMVLTGAAAPKTAKANEIALAMDKRYLAELDAGQARAAVLPVGTDWQALNLEAAIFVSRPRLAMAGITAAFDVPPKVTPGIHETAIISASAKLGKNVSIGAFSTVGDDVEIGDGAVVLSQVTIAEETRIGPDALIYSGVRIGSRVRIGARFIAHYNAVIGSDGFSFVTPEVSAVEEARASLGSKVNARQQSYLRIASNASVTLGDDVEIGACSTIDKGTIADTSVGNGTKIDNHVQIGHNVQIGQDCLLCAHSAIAGSSVLGDRVVLGGQAGVGDHLTLGNDVIAAGATAILSNVPAGRIMMGYPAMRMDKNIEAYKALRRLPRLIERIEKLEAALAGGKSRVASKDQSDFEPK